MNKIISFTDRLLAWIMVILMGVLVVDVVWQVTTRYVMGSASSFTEEIARYLLIWIGLLGSVYAYKMNLHLAFDFFSAKVTGKRKIWLGTFIHSLIAIFSFLVLVLGGGYLVQLTWELNQVSAALQIRLAYVYSVLPLSGLLLIFYSVHFMREIHLDEESDEIPETKSSGVV